MLKGQESRREVSGLQIFELVLKVGDFGLLVAVLFGLYRATTTLGPQAITAITKLGGALEGLRDETRAGFATLDGRIEEVEKAVGIDKRLSEMQRTTEEARHAAEVAAVATGQHAAIVAERSSPTTPGRGFPPIRPPYSSRGT
jgi:hypothetical protein